MSGGFWVLEGMDGAGKSTQAALLVEELESRGHRPLHVREPGSTRLGEGLRALLLDPSREAWDPRSEALLFFAARNELLRTTIAPALAAGRDVLCERFTPSTVAYQGQDGRADWVLALDRLVVAPELQPHGVFILDLEPESSFSRVGGEDGPDGFEQRGIQFQRQVRSGYLAYAEANPERTRVVAAQNRSIPSIAADILQAVEVLRP